MAFTALAIAAPGASAAVSLQVVDAEMDEPALTQNYTALAPFDVDADGLPDIFTTGEARARSDFRYSRPTPAGLPNLDGPVARPGCGGCAPLPVDGAASAVVGGKPYLLAFDPGQAALRLFGRREGVIQFEDSATFASNVQSAAISDPTGDELPDSAVLLADGSVSVIPGGPGGSFGNATLDEANAVPVGTVSGTPVAIRMADVAGSSASDVVVLTAGAQPRLWVATATSAFPLAFGPLVQFTVPADGRDFEISDLDGDGRRDFVVGTGDGVSAARNESGSGGQIVGATSTRSFNVIPDVVVADVDGDGSGEIVAAMSSTLAVALLDVTGTSPGAPESFDTINGVNRLTAADLEGDGADEIVVAGRGVDVLTNVSPGAAAATPASAVLGSVEVGRTGSPTRIEVASNREGTERVRSVAVEGAAAFDVLVRDDCRGFLAPGASCALHARLSPSAVGTRTAQIRVDLQHAPDLLIPVSGQGTPQSSGPIGPQGPQGPAGPASPPASPETRRAAVLTRVGCRRRRGTRVRCALQLGVPTDLAGRLRLLDGRKTAGRGTLAAGARRAIVNGKLPARRRSLVVELAVPGLAAQRLKVTVPRARR